MPLSTYWSKASACWAHTRWTCGHPAQTQRNMKKKDGYLKKKKGNICVVQCSVIYKKCIIWLESIRYILSLHQATVYLRATRTLKSTDSLIELMTNFFFISTVYSTQFYWKKICGHLCLIEGNGLNVYFIVHLWILFWIIYAEVSRVTTNMINTQNLRQFHISLSYWKPPFI